MPPADSLSAEGSAGGSAERPGAAGPPGRLARLRGLRELTRDKYERKMYVAGLSIPATVLMAAWKTALLIVAPSAFLLINVIYALGVAGAKGVAFTAHRSSRRLVDDPRALERYRLRAYRSVGVIIVVLSALYVVSCLPLLLGGETSERYDPVVAVIIAAIAFAELGMSLGGVVVARRNKTLLVEAVRLTSLAGSLVLLVLTQTALMSFAYEGDASRYNGFSGVLFGTGAALIGACMLLRAHRLSRGTARDSSSGQVGPRRSPRKQGHLDPTV